MRMSDQRTWTNPISNAEKWLFSSVVALLYVGTLYQYYVGNQFAIVENGGDPFVHAEWLMSFAGGPVRRGFGGEIVFFISDTFGFNPLTTITAIQIALLLALIALLLFTLTQLQRAPLVIILLANPAFVVFWMFEFRVHGKEILSCLCFAPLIFAAFGKLGIRAALILSGALFLISGLLHEATVFFTPALGLSAVALLHGKLWHKAPMWFIASLAAFCAVIIGFNAFFATADAQKICDAVIERGLTSALCRSHIAFNAMSTSDTIEHVLGLLGQRPWPTLALSFILGYLPVFYAIREDVAYQKLALFVLIGGLAFAPLYVVALDYGRWLNMQISAVTLMILVGTACGWIKSVQRPIKRWVFYLLFALGLTWNITLVQGGMSTGVMTFLLDMI